MACDAQSLLNTAYAAGYAKLSERDLQACILAAACAGVGGGGTIGPGGDMVFGQIVVYVGAAPVASPANQNAPAIAYSSTGVHSTYSWNLTTFAWQ